MDEDEKTRDSSEAMSKMGFGQGPVGEEPDPVTLLVSVEIK